MPMGRGYSPPPLATLLPPVHVSPLVFTQKHNSETIAKFVFDKDG